MSHPYGDIVQGLASGDDLPRAPPSMLSFLPPVSKNCKFKKGESSVAAATMDSICNDTNGLIQHCCGKALSSPSSPPFCVNTPSMCRFQGGLPMSSSSVDWTTFQKAPLSVETLWGSVESWVSRWYERASRACLFVYAEPPRHCTLFIILWVPGSLTVQSLVGAGKRHPHPHRTSIRRWLLSS